MKKTAKRRRFAVWPVAGDLLGGIERLDGHDASHAPIVSGLWGLSALPQPHWAGQPRHRRGAPRPRRVGVVFVGGVLTALVVIGATLGIAFGVYDLATHRVGVPGVVAGAAGSGGVAGEVRRPPPTRPWSRPSKLPSTPPKNASRPDKLNPVTPRSAEGSGPRTFCPFTLGH